MNVTHFDDQIIATRSVGGLRPPWQLLRNCAEPSRPRLHHSATRSGETSSLRVPRLAADL